MNISKTIQSTGRVSFTFFTHHRDLRSARQFFRVMTGDRRSFHRDHLTRKSRWFAAIRPRESRWKFTCDLKILFRFFPLMKYIVRIFFSGKKSQTWSMHKFIIHYLKYWSFPHLPWWHKLLCTRFENWCQLCYLLVCCHCHCRTNNFIMQTLQKIF